MNKKMTYVDVPVAAPAYAGMINYAQQSLTDAVAVPEELLNGPLTQADMDRYVELSKAYLGGPNIPFEIQLAAFDEAGEEPYGILLDHDALSGMTVVDFLREMIPLRNRKSQHGVAEGVHDPEALLEVKQRAVLIYTRCALEVAEAEAIRDDARNQLQENIELPLITRTQLEALAKKDTRRMVYFPMPSGAHIGKNGYIHLFPGYPDSPVGQFRGDGAAFSAQECIDFIGKHFPDVEDEFLTALAL